MSLPPPELVGGSGGRAVKPKGKHSALKSDSADSKPSFPRSPAVSLESLTCLDSTVDDYIPKK